MKGRDRDKFVRMARKSRDWLEKEMAHQFSGRIVTNEMKINLRIAALVPDKKCKSV